MTYRKTQCWVCKGIGHSQFGYPCDWCHGSGWVIEHYRHRTLGQWFADVFGGASTRLLDVASRARLSLLDVVGRSYVAIIDWYIDTED